MSTPEESPVEAFPEYEVEGIGTVIAHEGDSYIVRTPDGRVVGYRAIEGQPSPELAATDIAFAIENPHMPPVPEEISRAEFIIALRKVLKIQEADVFALLSQLPKGETQEDARDLWEHARTFKRHNRFLLLLATNEGITADQLDEVFRVGHSLDLN
jgi:hypothetical protein